MRLAQVDTRPIGGLARGPTRVRVHVLHLADEPLQHAQPRLTRGQPNADDAVGMASADKRTLLGQSR